MGNLMSDFNNKAIRERIINYEKNHKKKDQEKSEYMTIFDNVMKLFE